MKAKIKDSLLSYIKLIPAVYIILFVLRFVETALVVLNYGFDFSIVKSEFIGLGYDIIAISTILSILFPFFSLVYIISTKLSSAIFKVLTYILVVAHFIIIKYFAYQLIPLDIFLYNYSLQEILFTIKTSNTSIVKTSLLILAILISVYLIFNFARKIRFKKITLIIMSLSIIICIIFSSNITDKSNKFSNSKTLYFAKQSYSYLNNNNDNIIKNYQTFYDMYPTKEFVNTEYPLLHKPDRTNQLGKYFIKSDTSPSIVILIIEGLNDDFIHEYKETLLMPFLSELKGKSLYWNKCFTLGERSFAVVPSTLGGLPYGEKGFTLLNRLPKHLSMVSVLKSNNYNTTFFYGQGSWFHQKNRFFKHNNINLVFDNSRFSEKYNKIIVGDDNFFWGYNDKDLFNQSLEVIDTTEKKRLDIYFTGTSHSPFVIENEEYYTDKLTKITTSKNKSFFNTYNKYIKTILFLDDALKDFFTEYAKHENYKNTIFIITGDHPMTEIPIANSLKRYHVPLIIFSENLKEHKTFTNTVSHLDISETIYNLLQDYGNSVPTISTSLGNTLLPDNRTPCNYAFMNDNREIIDFYSDGYYLTKDELYKVDSNLNITEINDEKLKLSMMKKLDAFKNISLHSSINNKIIPNDIFCNELNRSIIYSLNNNDTINIESEYYNLTENIEIPNTAFTLDINLDISTSANSDIFVVYQLISAKDSSLLWSNFGINKNNLQPQLHVNIGKQNISDSTIYFKSFVWNKNKSDLIISNIDILLHSEK